MTVEEASFGTLKALASRLRRCFTQRRSCATRMGNPTLVFVTDRNDLDDQLFGEVFGPASPPLGLLPERPVQAETRSDLRAHLRRASGGIVFTTMKKFTRELSGDTNPVLCDRRNLVVVADEAHRSQYGFSESLKSVGTRRLGLQRRLDQVVAYKRNGRFRAKMFTVNQSLSATTVSSMTAKARMIWLPVYAVSSQFSRGSVVGLPLRVFPLKIPPRRPSTSRA